MSRRRWVLGFCAAAVAGCGGGGSTGADRPDDAATAREVAPDLVRTDTAAGDDGSKEAGGGDGPSAGDSPSGADGPGGADLPPSPDLIARDASVDTAPDAPNAPDAPDAPNAPDTTISLTRPMHRTVRISGRRPRACRSCGPRRPGAERDDASRSNHRGRDRAHTGSRLPLRRQVDRRTERRWSSR